MSEDTFSYLFPNEGKPLKCPRCGSEFVTANKKGFSAGKAIGGAILTGGIGLMAGFIGSGKIKNSCMHCGHKWKPTF